MAELRERRGTPHVAQNISGRARAIDGRTIRHPGYEVSQRISKRIEGWAAERTDGGWMKTSAGQAQTRWRGVERVRRSFTLTAAAYNPIRLAEPIAAPA